MRVNDRLVWIDCEMTGLDIERDALIEIACVVTDSDLNLLDGSAIWLQSVTQALVAAGCAVTLVLKAPVRTDRLIAPLRDVADVTIRSPHAENLLPGLTESSLTVPQAITVLATVDAAPGKKPVLLLALLLAAEENAVLPADQRGDADASVMAAATRADEEFRG